MMKDTLIFGMIVLLALAVLLAACEKGQRRVDFWEQRTGRIGQGLR